MESQNNNDCRPSVRGEIKKARNSGYDLHSSLFEFIDNACDTDCHHIKIEIKEKMEQGVKKLCKIIISDDFELGIGESAFHKIFSWTFERDRQNHDIGEYGTGFKCASVNIANCLSVYTFDAVGQKYRKALADWDEMEEMNRWDPKILEINEEFYRDYHPFTRGTSFVLENLRHEFFQNQKTPYLLAENLYYNIGYHYKYYLQKYDYKEICIKGIYSEGKMEKVLSCKHKDCFYFYFDYSLHTIQSKIFVYKDQANFYNFFIQKSVNFRIELVEFVEKRKNGNSHLKCTEVSHRILASMTLIDEILLKSCIYAHDENTILSYGNVDVIQNNRIVGRDICFRRPRNDTMAEYIRHEIHFESKNLNQIMGIQFNKKSHLTDNDLCYSMEYLQTYHERELIRLANKPVEVIDPEPVVASQVIEIPKIQDSQSDLLEALVEKLQSQSIQEPPIIPECEQELELQPTSLQTPIAVREYNVEPAMVATEEEARSKRKNFSLETKLQIIKKQVCRDSDFDFLLHDEILPLDYDHIEDRTNNSEDNCQALCVISHAIKTRKPNIYKKITNDKESFIINLLNCLTSSKIFLKMYREGKVGILPIEDVPLSSGIFFKN